MITETRRHMGAYTYLSQTAVWIPRAPRDWVPIAEMDDEWRWNCAQLLVRNAAYHAGRYGWSAYMSMADAPDEVVDWELNAAAQREREPQKWMRTTKLYQALVTGLPAKRRKLATLADRARHYNTCQVRTGAGEHGECTCAAGAGASAADIDAALVVIREIRAAARKAERERLAAEAAEAKRKAWLEWMDANPGMDPDTKRPWGVDEHGVDHGQPHTDNVHCQYDSCRNCGGYHCGLYCGADDAEQEL